MSERDELVERVKAEISHNISPVIGWLRWDAVNGRDDSDHKRLDEYGKRLDKASESVADLLKPRTVTTVEELDALPVGTVVLNRGRSWQRYNPRIIGLYEYHSWQCPDGGFLRDSHGLAFLLPATVLFTPETTP